MTKHINKSHVIFIGGGFDKELGIHIIKDVSERFKSKTKDNKNITISYHGWMSETFWSDDITDEVLELRRNDPSIHICVVGHSYGGSAAVQAAQSLDRKRRTEPAHLLNIDLMITLDPVSRLHPCPTKRPQSIRYWINIDANEDDNSIIPKFSNLIASIGGNWSDTLKSLVDVYFDSKTEHGFAQTMLETPYKIDSKTYTAWEVLIDSARWGASARGPKPRGGFLYTVHPNDTLWAISSRLYGRASYWPLIRDANPRVISRKGTLIHPGATLFIPMVLDEVKIFAK